MASVAAAAALATSTVASIATPPTAAASDAVCSAEAFGTFAGRGLKKKERSSAERKYRRELISARRAYLLNSTQTCFLTPAKQAKADPDAPVVPVR